MATLTITHDDRAPVLEDVVRIVTTSGARAVNATRPGFTVVTFDSENQARAVAAPLIATPFVASVEVER
jgi:hypothetical protein